MARKFLAFLITILIIIILSLVGVGITYVLRVTNIDSNIKTFLERENIISYTTISTIVSSPVADLDLIPDVITEIDTNNSKLVSDVLKLSFTFKTSSGDYAVLTSKKGNRITIKAADQNETDAQFVELFAKKTDETFAQAIKRIFLDGVPEAFCYFSTESFDYKFKINNLETGAIKSGTGVKPEQCPTPYTKDSTAGKRLFIYNPAFPDRFGFIYVGNAPVQGGTSGSFWFESIEFIK